MNIFFFRIRNHFLQYRWIPGEYQCEHSLEPPVGPSHRVTLKIQIHQNFNIFALFEKGPQHP